MPDPSYLESLVARHRAGEVTAFAGLIEVTQRQVRSAIAARIWSLDAVDLLVQDTYVAAFEHLDRYVGDGRFLAWLLSIARNLSLAWLERQHREGRRRESILSDLAAGLPAAEADEELLTEDIQRLQRCLDTLPSTMRSMLNRVYRDNWPLDRLAKQVGSTVGAVAVALFRIRKQLQICMNRQGEG